MKICFLIADMETPKDLDKWPGPDIKGVCLTANTIYDFDDLLNLLDGVRYHDRCQDKFYSAAFDDIKYEVVQYNGASIGRFSYIGVQYLEWTDRVIDALKEQRPDYDVVVVQPEALATIVGNTRGLTLDDLTGPWKGVVVQG